MKSVQPLGHLAIKDTPLLRTVAKSPAKVTDIWAETNSRYNGLSLLRAYGHFIRSQRHNFIVFLSRYSGHRAASCNICTHIKTIFFSSAF